MLNVLTQPDVRSAPGPLAVAAAVHSIGRFHEIENRSMKFHEISELEISGGISIQL